MPRINTVKKAQVSKVSRRCFKCSHVVQPGEPYFHWSIMSGSRGVKKFACQEHWPSSRDLERSEFRLAIFGIEDTIGEAVTAFRAGEEDPDFDALAEAMREAGTALRDLSEETGGKFDNMPEGLQQGEIGQLLESRRDATDEKADECDTAADEIEACRDAVKDESDWAEFATDESMEKGEEDPKETDEEFEERVKDRLKEHNSEQRESAIGHAEDLDLATD